MRFLFRLVLNALALLAIAYYIPGIQVASFWYALLAAIALGLVNTVIGTVLKIVTLPINLLTLGLFSLAINAFLFWMTGRFLDGFEVTGVSGAFIGSILMSVASWLSYKLLSND